MKNKKIIPVQIVAARTSIRIILATTAFIALAISGMSQGSWNIATDYSGSSNPSGAWSYGRKWSATANAMDLFTVQWDSGGWYLGNVGDGSPSVSPGGPQLWAKYNDNGLPCIRWTCPETGYYDISGGFTATDNRAAVDVFVYASVNGSIVFSNRFLQYLQSASFTNNLAYLNQGDFVDYTIAWGGTGGGGLYNWTTVAATISTNLTPQTATATASVVNGFVVGANVITSGQGYTNTPQVRFIGGGGTGAQAVAVVSNGIVTAVHINNPGSGYTNAPIVVIAPPYILNPILSIAPMSFLSFSNLTVDGVYQLQQLEQSYYWSNQPVSFTATNTQFTDIVAGVVNSGDYRLALSPTPSQAFATAQVVNGFVVGVTLTSGGSGYVTVPAVHFVGGSGSNATAVASISSAGVVTNLTLTGPGAGYADNTIVEIDPPPAVSVSPTVLPMMQINAVGLSPYDNYEIQFAPDLGASWSDWNDGLFSPTEVTNTQVLFITNNVGFFRLHYLP